MAYANVSLVIIEVLAIVMIRLVKVDYNRFNIIRKIADDGLIRSLFFLILSLGFVALYEIRPLLQKGINVPRCKGDFFADIPLYEKLDFYKEELLQMKNLGLNSSLKELSFFLQILL